MAISDTVVPLPLDVWPYYHTSMPSSTTLNFYGTDSEEIFNRNTSNLKQDWVYRNINVEYNFNQQHLRQQQNLQDIGADYILCSGTSFGMGLGVREEDRYCDKVSAALNLDYVNFCGPTYTTKIQAISFTNLLKSNFHLPKIMILEYAPYPGTTFYIDNEFVMCYTKHMPTDEKYELLRQAYTNINQTNMLLHEANIHRNQILSTCKRLGIKVVEVSFHPNDPFAIDNNIMSANIESNKDDISYCYARDVKIHNGEYTGHPGIGIHNEVTAQILKRL